MNRCVFVRVCVLFSVLCLGAHVYVEFKGFYVKSRRTLAPTKEPQKHTRTLGVLEESRGLSESVPTCHLTGRQKDRRSLRWRIELEPWASKSRTLEDEAFRFIKYITTPQLSCRNPADSLPAQGSWALCLDNRFSLARSINSKHCRVYSLGLGGEDKQLERVLAKAGCEVHCFDPSIREAHLQDSHMWLHRLSIDWRDPNPAVMTERQHSSTKKLSAVLNHYGHRQLDVLKVDMESAEWKILENLILENVLPSVGLLILEVHLHWAGFEVSGDESSVVRYWFSLLKEMENTHFRLYHSYKDPAKPQLFLQKNIHNASSTYILGWVNECYLAR
ncbi:probable methyltransferase-like protein 24 [Clarias gariepinus]|uniref:probable methyltransferase-like protein 24 n=1 Tax=Clarias gariepinus TaxID=13013 RepID=UPI00234D8257|nr:probable methyltransferase-like protein 24 [Clarias gariepinus]